MNILFGLRSGFETIVFKSSESVCCRSVKKKTWKKDVQVRLQGAERFVGTGVLRLRKLFIGKLFQLPLTKRRVTDDEL